MLLGISICATGVEMSKEVFPLASGGCPVFSLPLQMHMKGKVKHICSVTESSTCCLGYASTYLYIQYYDVHWLCCTLSS